MTPAKCLDQTNQSSRFLSKRLVLFPLTAILDVKSEQMGNVYRSHSRWFPLFKFNRVCD